jgi:hypothetical protein
MISPLALLNALAALNAAAAVRVDADTFAKLCERPDAQRLILNGVLCVDLDGVTYRRAEALYHEAPRADLDTAAAFARSPLDILTAAALNAAAAVNVDADTFAKLCERPDAQRFTLDDLADGVAFDGCVTADGVAYRVNVAPAAFERSIFAAAAGVQPKAARVDADTFAKLCARPGAQRYIVNGSTHGVIVDGADYTVN